MIATFFSISTKKWIFSKNCQLIKIKTGHNISAPRWGALISFLEIKLIRIKRYSVANKVLIAFFAFTGIVLQTGLYEGNFNIGVFRMFTNLTNLLCGIYFLFAAAAIAADKTRGGGQSPFPLVKGICTMSITLTGIIAAAVVASEFDMHTPSGIATVLLHIVTPVMILADWLVFDTKGRWKKTYPLIWLISPAVYFTYIMISSLYIPKGTKLRFPYPFLNYENLGVFWLIFAVAIISIFYVGIGYLCYLIDRKMGRLEVTVP